MSVQIIERGRGPEIEGTRITVYTVMDYVRAGEPPEKIADYLQLCPEQVEAAIEYIEAHREEVDREYERILERVRKGNPPWVEALLAKSAEELKARIRAREKERADADRVRS